MWVSAAELLLGSVSHSSGQFIKNFHWLFATSRNPRPQLRGNCICAEGDGSGSFTGLVKKIKLIPREISAAHSAYCQIGNKLFDLRWPPAAQEKKKQWHCIGHLDNKLRCRRVELKLKPPKCSANQNVGLGYYIFQWLLLLLSATTRVLGRHHNFFPCPVPWWSSLGWGVKPRVQPQLPLQQKSIKCKWMSIGRLNKICRFMFHNSIHIRGGYLPISTATRSYRGGQGLRTHRSTRWLCSEANSKLLFTRPSANCTHRSNYVFKSIC